MWLTQTAPMPSESLASSSATSSDSDDSPELSGALLTAPRPRSAARMVSCWEAEAYAVIDSIGVARDKDDWAASLEDELEHMIDGMRCLRVAALQRERAARSHDALGRHSRAQPGIFQSLSLSPASSISTDRGDTPPRSVSTYQETPESAWRRWSRRPPRGGVRDRSAPTLTRARATASPRAASVRRAAIVTRAADDCCHKGRLN